MRGVEGSEIGILGYTDGYDYQARKKAYRELAELQRKGLPYESLSAEAKRVLSAANSFSAPTYAMLDALNDAGIKVKAYDISKLSQLSDAARREIIANIANDRRIASVIQVGNMPGQTELMKQLSRSGKHLGRMATDYGAGGFLQPKYHLMGFGDTGYLNGMYIDPTVKYDSIYVPGGNLRKWRGIPAWARSKVVSVGRLATSPLFDAFSFNTARPDGKATAMLFTGGGSGIGLPFEKELSGSLGAASRTSLLGGEENILDHILSALRKKHGDNFTFKFLSALQDDPGLNSRVQAAGTMGLKNFKSELPSVGVYQDVNRLRYLLDPNSELSKGIEELEGGKDFLRNIRTRYKGLEILGRIPQADMAKMYAGSDYIIGLPGSSVGEPARMKGQVHGGMIHLVPRKHELYPQHFEGNALASNAIMQPHAKHNIVHIDSRTLKNDIEQAIMEGGTKDWGRTPIMTSEEALAPLVGDAKKILRPYYDNRRVDRLAANIRALFSSGRSKKMKLSALKRVLSLRGLADMNLGLGGLIAKNPIMRRAALPTAAATLAGLGAYRYYKDKKRKIL